MKRGFIGLMSVGLCLLSACNNPKSSTGEDSNVFNWEGNWIEVMPVNKQYVQGICFQSGGKAESIGMATLKYESWKVWEGKQKLILTGKSIGNGQTIEFSDTLDIITT